MKKSILLIAGLVALLCLTAKDAEAGLFRNRKCTAAIERHRIVHRERHVAVGCVACQAAPVVPVEPIPAPKKAK